MDTSTKRCIKYFCKIIITNKKIDNLCNYGYNYKVVGI
jgi:hypothetical protein